MLLQPARGPETGALWLIVFYAAIVLSHLKFTGKIKFLDTKNHKNGKPAGDTSYFIISRRGVIIDIKIICRYHTKHVDFVLGVGPMGVSRPDIT